MRSAVIVLLFSLLFLGETALSQNTATAPAAAPVAKAEKYWRTELYFGRSKPDGTLVSDEEWKSFLKETVTPRFPDGFTAISAIGQYREKSGRIISEPSMVLIFLYGSRTKKESRAEIEEIRTAYMTRFDQESVLRVDLPKRVSVTF